MFTLPIVEIARAMGVEVHIASSSDEALSVLGSLPIDAVLMDMRISSDEFIAQVVGVYPVAGFGPHVEGEKFLEFRKYGVKTLWPNSKLRDKLPEWLKSVTSDNH